MEKNIVYEDEEVVVYSDYNAAGHIYDNDVVNLYVVNKIGIESINISTKIDKYEQKN